VFIENKPKSKKGVFIVNLGPIIFALMSMLNGSPSVNSKTMLDL
jgi:hypothetical protein